MKARISFPWEGFLTMKSLVLGWPLTVFCFTQTVYLFLREKFRCRVWEYDFIAIHVITAVFVLRIETASTLELVTEPVS